MSTVLQIAAVVDDEAVLMDAVVDAVVIDSTFVLQAWEQEVGSKMCR